MKNTLWNTEFCLAMLHQQNNFREMRFFTITLLFFLDKTANSKMAPVVISPSGKHTGTLIFCHGLGDTGHGWASTLADVRQSHVKIICPTAETMPVTLNSGKIEYIDFGNVTNI